MSASTPRAAGHAAAGRGQAGRGPAGAAAASVRGGGRAGVSAGVPAGRAEPRRELLDAVRLRLARTGAEATPARLAGALRAQGRPLGDAEVLEAARRLRSELVGAGPLDPLLADPAVTDILVNGPAEVWIDRGRGLERVPGVRFADPPAVRRLAQRLAAAAGRRLDDARPWVDARLPDGTRLHAVLPPIAAGCTHISLRTAPARAFSLDELVAAGSLPPEGAALMRAVIRSGLSFLVSGSTGSGKTTLLSSLLGAAGPGERIVVAEDCAELRPDHPHVVRLEARPANQDGAGRISLRDLVRQALRMRPDRLVVGEVRGPEVCDLLAALNTGHAGCGTLHANRAADVPARLEALACSAGLDRPALHSQLAAALEAVVHVVRDPLDGRRRVAEIHLPRRGSDGLVVTVPAVGFTAEGGMRPGPAWPLLAERCGLNRGGPDPGGPDPGGLHRGGPAGSGDEGIGRGGAER